MLTDDHSLPPAFSEDSDIEGFNVESFVGSESLFSTSQQSDLQGWTFSVANVYMAHLKPTIRVVLRYLDESL